MLTHSSPKRTCLVFGRDAGADVDPFDSPIQGPRPERAGERQIVDLTYRTIFSAFKLWWNGEVDYWGTAPKWFLWGKIEKSLQVSFVADAALTLGESFDQWHFKNPRIIHPVIVANVFWLNWANADDWDFQIASVAEPDLYVREAAEHILARLGHEVPTPKEELLLIAFNGDERQRALASRALANLTGGD